ncbi:hypothetical protein SDC9_11373 [bioreactor metagenome]|uniref:Small, acid-soluble spore protein, alpha/beta type n=1 Tax=bioreactor metagenome TaxID=1076179 RepID=A0A644TG80_9ZZZZ|nr:small, acid-soluble spore protein, alpha/beta type [Negativicutes bacterium]
MGEVMSDKLKKQLAYDLGFGEKIEDGDWSDVTTGEVGSMVREAIKRAETTLVDDAKTTNETKTTVK